jgi:hypothetical protein
MRFNCVSYLVSNGTMLNEWYIEQGVNMSGRGPF